MLGGALMLKTCPAGRWLHVPAGSCIAMLQAHEPAGRCIARRAPGVRPQCTHACRQRLPAPSTPAGVSLTPATCAPCSMQVGFLVGMALTLLPHQCFRRCNARVPSWPTHTALARPLSQPHPHAPSYSHIHNSLSTHTHTQLPPFLELHTAAAVTSYTLHQKRGLGGPCMPVYP